MTRLQWTVLVLAIACIAIGLWFMYLSRQPANPLPPLPPTVNVPVPTPPLPPAVPTPQPPTLALLQSPQIFLGNPSGATTERTDRDNYLMLKPYFALAYNNAAGEPRWVGWRVIASDLGTAPRKRTFDPDATLPAGFKVVVTRDYTGGGFDRGHMCPHSDRAGNLEMSYATFCMTNIIPQSPNVNRKAWAQLENYSRELVRVQHDRLYIVSGPYGRSGVGSKGPADSLANGSVVVPSECWKVIVVVPDTGADDLAVVHADSRVIAVDMPNDDTKVGEEWAGFRCSVRSIEDKTGLHFFDRLPADVRSSLENEVDTQPIAAPAPLIHESADGESNARRRH